jgi:predicted O-linked N-acetylglucosamine transferase (SPINDLY family)
MDAVPHSRLVVMLPGLVANNQHVTSFFQRNGIAPERVEFVDFAPQEKYLELYHDVDISLDPFPYNGHTTSLDSLFMGVPLITLAGKTSVSRAGVSFLTNLNLTDLIAQTPEEYVSIAASLAGDLPKLTQLRSTLRTCLMQSALNDPAATTRALETAYRSAWQSWCAARPPAAIDL